MSYKLLVLIILCALSSVVQAADKALTADIAMTATQQQSLGVTVTGLSKNTSMTIRRFPAEVVIPTGQERVVSAAQSGLIDQLFIAAGQPVKKGQAIAHLMSADLVNLQKDYLQALTQNKLIAKSFVRDAALFKDGIIPERRYLETESAQEEIKALLAQRKQALRLAGMDDPAIAKLNSAKGMSNGMTLVAPMDGVVLEQMVITGQRVEMGMPLYRIGRLNPLWLEIHAPLENLQQIKIGMPVHVPKFQASGKLIAIIRHVNKADQTLDLRAEITKNNELLSPGQFVEAEISLSGETQYLTIPKAALIKHGIENGPKSGTKKNSAKNWLFIQTKNGFHPVSVKVISEQADEVVIDSQLTGNEKIAISGLLAIKGVWLGLGAE